MRAAATFSALIALLSLLTLARTTPAASTNTHRASPLPDSSDAGPQRTTAPTPRGAALLVGRVLDNGESPIAEALVLVIASGAIVPAASGITDDEGRFHFSELPPGRYVLLAIHGHHSPGRSAPVVLGQLGSPFPIRITLASDAIAL